MKRITERTLPTTEPLYHVGDRIRLAYQRGTFDITAIRRYGGATCWTWAYTLRTPSGHIERMAFERDIIERVSTLAEQRAAFDALTEARSAS